jgi:hypothetical protein
MGSRRGVLVQDAEVQLLGPPVAVGHRSGRGCRPSPGTCSRLTSWTSLWFVMCSFRADVRPLHRLVGGVDRVGWRGLVETLRAAAPVDDLGFVDDEARVVGGRQARGGADGAVDIDHAAAGAADQMVVVVADPILVPCRRTGGLDPSDQPVLGQDAQRVVHRLPGDDADVFGPACAMSSAVAWGCATPRPAPPGAEPSPAARAAGGVPCDPGA